jgi:hypothetical protein
MRPLICSILHPATPLLAIILAAALSVTALAAAAAETEGMVPFVIPTTPNPKSLAAVRAGEALAVDAKRVEARDGHFWRDGKRYRVWGVNICFGAAFPTHADAERVAERLAQAGINSVRLHHMDCHPFPNGIWGPKGEMELSAEALDRLDYFIDQLARHGVCANVNLHVSRTHSKFLGLPREGEMPDYDKVIGIFTPKLVEAQRKYARDLLTHVNAYRKVRYADDPAVAFVEITNEDSFFMWDGEHRLRTLAPYYDKILRDLWVDWLKGRYGTSDGLKAAWNKGAQPLGENLVADPAFAALALARPKDPNTPRWELEQHSPAAAHVKALADVKNAARVEIDKVDATEWHIQFKNVHLKLRGGQYYTVTFRARADEPRKISLAVGMEHAPWGNLGLQRTLTLGKEWKAYRMGFTASADDDHTRLSFTVGGGTAAVEIADVSLATGGQVGILPGESLEAGVALFADSEVEARAMDRIRFLMQTEKAYFDGLRQFVRKDLGCGAMVTGTIVFGPAGLYAQSDMDFVDGHAYWHHPNFPGRAWDMGNWLVDQTAMIDSRDGGELSGLACNRLAGKPYTISEYNHPAPMDTQAECVPMIAAFAASQDWDGVWLFAYSHGASDWDRRSFTSFFDIDANPAKFGFLAPAAVMFRDGGLAPMAGQKVCRIEGAADALSAFAALKYRNGDSMRNVVTGQFKVPWSEMLANRIYVSAGAKPAAVGESGEPIQWTVQNGRGQFIAMGRDALTEVFWAGGAGQNKPTFQAVAVAALDGKPLADSRKVLIAGCGQCENTGMVFSADRRTVGRDWGKPPVLIEPVDQAVKLPGKPGEKLKLQPLGPDGLPAGEPAAITLGQDNTVRLEPNYKTMWYLITRE